MKRIHLLLATTFISTQLFAANANQVWGTYQGNPAHTGYSDTTVIPDAIKPLWSRELTPPPGNHTTLGQPVVAQGNVYFHTHTYRITTGGATYPDSLLALNAANGETRWQQDIDLLYTASSISYDNQKLYVMLMKQSELQRKLTQSNILITAYDADTSKTIFSQPAQLSNGVNDWNSQAPVIDHHQLFLGTMNMQLAANADNGYVQWRSGDVSGMDNLAVVNKDYVIRLMNNAISLLSRKSGKLVKSIQGADAQYWTEDTPVILNEAQNIVYAVFFNRKDTRQLTAIDLNTSQVKWKLDLPANYKQPLYANGMLYVMQTDDLDTNNLYAIDANSGTITWTLPINEDIRVSPILTKNALFIYTQEHLLIVSLETHQIIKTITTRGSGNMAIANNTLYLTEMSFSLDLPETMFVSAYSLN